MYFLPRNFSLSIALLFLFVTLGCSSGISSKSRNMQTVQIFKLEKQIERLRKAGAGERELREIEDELKRIRRIKEAWLLKDILAAQGKENKAEREVRSAIKKHAGDKQYFFDELKKSVAMLYKDAMELYMDGSYDKSENIFMEIDELWPDYKLTRKYLTLIDEEKGADL